MPAATGRDSAAHSLDRAGTPAWALAPTQLSLCRRVVPGFIRLPREPTGYYHEYTVPTPGSSDRGARRIITGSATEMYWTDDHYRSFERILR